MGFICKSPLKLYIIFLPLLNNGKLFLFITMHEPLRNPNYQYSNTDLICWTGEKKMCQRPETDFVHFSGCESLAARSIELRPELLHVSVCLQGKQIKDASHFRGCKSAPGDGSGVSDTPNPPRAASTYRLPIHVSSKWTLRTSSIIKCSRNKRCYLFKQSKKKRLHSHTNWVYF